MQLENLLGKLERESWVRIGGSVYLVEEKCSRSIVELLKRFEGPDLRWFKFRVESDCTRVH
jgi:virulence-associated protein VapD